MKLPGFVKRLWTTFKSPSKAALWVILLMGFFGGVIFWGGFQHRHGSDQHRGLLHRLPTR